MGITAYHVFTSPVADGTNTQLVRPSNWNSSHALTLNAVGSEISNAFGNGGGVTFGYDGTNITASAPGGGSDGYNSAQFTNSTANSTMPIVWAGNSNGSGNLTMGLTGSTVTASFSNPSIAGLISAINVSAGTTSGNVSAITFSNSNGVSFGLNGGVITGSHNGLTTARASNDAIGLNTALTAGPLAWTVNSSGLSLNASNAAGTTSGFGGNLISGSMTHNTAGLNLSLNHPAWLTTARASNDAIGLNSAQSNVTWTLNSSGLSLDARGYAGTGTSATNASITLNSNGLAISVAAPGGGAAINVSAGTTSNNLQTLQFNNSNGVTFGLNGSTVTASVAGADGGNTLAAGTRSAGSNSIVLFSNANNFTWGLDNVNGSVMTASYDAPPLLAWANNLYQFNSQTIQPRQSTSAVFPVAVDNNISFDHIRFPMSVSMGSTTLATTANTTLSAGVSYTFNVGFYRTGTANATSLSSYITTNAGLSQSINIGANANGSQYTVTLGLTYPQNGTGTNITNTFSSSYAVSTSNFAVSTTGLTAFTGMKHFEMPFVSSLPDDMYWVNLGVSSTTSTQGIAGLSSPLVIHSFWGMSQPNNTWGFFGQANNASVQVVSGIGSFTTAGGGTVAGLGFSNISSSASHVVPYVYMEFDG